MDTDLEETTALVTGASRGIGRATAEALAAAGADVGLVARSEDAIAELADELRDRHGVAAWALPADVRDHEAVADAVGTAAERGGGLETLVCNAGLSRSHDDRAEDLPVEEFRAVTETNVHGTYYATRAALPHLREAGGTAVFIGSSAGKLPRPGAPVYAASKWWVRGFALSVEAHAGRDGVGVSLISPTAVRTGLWPDLEPGEAAEPEEVADLAVLAASQPAHSTLSQVDLFRRDLLGKFVPEEIDIEVPFETE